LALGLTSLFSVGYASGPAVSSGPSLRLSLSSTTPPNQAILQDLQGPGTPQAPYLEPRQVRPRSTQDAIAALAYKISYVGSILLTADQVVRSVDSVMDSMKLQTADGSMLRLQMRPESKGFEMMLRLSRPL